MVPKMTYVEMVEQCCNANAGKWSSRAMIKSYLTKNFGIVDNATTKVHLKKALTKFEKKGDSYKVSKTAKKSANKEKLAAKTKSAPASAPSASSSKRAPTSGKKGAAIKQERKTPSVT